jgi:hypothetical protein
VNCGIWFSKTIAKVKAVKVVIKEMNVVKR